MKDPATNDQTTNGPATSEEDRFCAEVADGLHALAQPLSILRSAIEIISLPGEASSRYMSVAAQQMDRTSKIFFSLQSLVASRMEPARCAAIDLAELVRPIVQDWTGSLEGFGIALDCEIPATPLMVMADRERTEETISALLEAASSSAARGDKVEFRMLASENEVECSIANTRQGAQRVNSVARLNLAVARRNMASQQGSLRFSEDPFRASAAWPTTKMPDEGRHGDGHASRQE